MTPEELRELQRLETMMLLSCHNGHRLSPSQIREWQIEMKTLASQPPIWLSGR